MGKAYGLNTQVLLANLQHCCNNNIIILNYYYFIPGLFPSHSWWAESCLSDSAEGWCACAASNLGASRVSIRMDDRTDGQRMDDGTHGFRGGFISHPDVLYYIGYVLFGAGTNVADTKSCHRNVTEEGIQEHLCERD